MGLYDVTRKEYTYTGNIRAVVRRGLKTRLVPQVERLVCPLVTSITRPPYEYSEEQKRKYYNDHTDQQDGPVHREWVNAPIDALNTISIQAKLLGNWDQRGAVMSQSAGRFGTTQTTVYLTGSARVRLHGKKELVLQVMVDTVKRLSAEVSASRYSWRDMTVTDLNFLSITADLSGTNMPTTPQQSNIIHYVCGLVFHGNEVMLIQKKRPGWMAGKYNGIGGHVEPGETSLQAMQREAREEAGIEDVQWIAFLQGRVVDKTATVDWFCAFVPSDKRGCTMTDENVVWVKHSEVATLPVVQDLRWAIAAALESGPSGKLRISYER